MNDSIENIHVYPATTQGLFTVTSLTFSTISPFFVDRFRNSLMFKLELIITDHYKNNIMLCKTFIILLNEITFIISKSTKKSYLFDIRYFDVYIYSSFAYRLLIGLLNHIGPSFTIKYTINKLHFLFLFFINLLENSTAACGSVVNKDGRMVTWMPNAIVC